MSRRNTYLISFPKQKHSSTWKVYTSRPRSITRQYAKTLTHHIDTYGRNIGYSIDTIRQSTLSYDPATGRMIGMNASGDFTWDYLANTNLKSKLTYPNDTTAEWTYEPQRNLLTSVTNSLCLSASVINPQVISQYDYTNDAIARRTAMGKSGSMMAETDTLIMVIMLVMKSSPLMQYRMPTTSSTMPLMISAIAKQGKAKLTLPMP